MDRSRQRWQWCSGPGLRPRPSRSPASGRHPPACAHHGHGVPHACCLAHRHWPLLFLLPAQPPRPVRSVQRPWQQQLLLPVRPTASRKPAARALRIHSNRLERRCSSSGSSSPRLPLPYCPSSWASMISALRSRVRISPSSCRSLHCCAEALRARACARGSSPCACWHWL